MDEECIKVLEFEIKDLRFPTSLASDGSDAMHTNPDYSIVYVVIHTDKEHCGYGLTFTLGRGNEIVLKACQTISSIIRGLSVKDIFSNFANFWRAISSDSQLRWLGPEKGVVHLALAAIVNAFWDLWARIEGKPVWKLLVDMTPEQLVSVIDFRYITDVLTKEEAIDVLKRKEAGKEEREKILLRTGYPAYTTQVGWMGYSDDKVGTLCNEYMNKGFTAFKVKVGQNLPEDIRRCKLIREKIGWQNTLMLDANQIWGVNEAIEWMRHLKKYKPLWIEEPTSPDDILGHAKIRKEIESFKIGVATGEMCANRIMFKQMFQAQAIDYCQIDSARLGGINEILAVYLMANKYEVPVCPHAGGVGLCEMVQHLQMWDFISLSGSCEKRWIEYVDQQHEHFEDPVILRRAFYTVPTKPGYSTKLKESAILNYEFPNGKEWQRLFKDQSFDSEPEPMNISDPISM